MGNLRLLLRIGGIVVLATGVICLPVGYGVNPKRDLDAFFNLADMGVSLKLALYLIITGVVLLVTSLLAPGDEPE